MNYKINQFTLILLMISISLFSCDPSGSQMYPKYTGRWSLFNSTADTLIVIYNDSGKAKPTCIYTVYPDSSVSLVYSPYNLIGNSKEEADAGFHYLTYPPSTKDTLFVYSLKTNKELKLWKESDKDSPGKQFFNESSWTKTTYEADGYINYVWTFTILPDDIK
jgi:hypothetical protein